MDINQIMHFLNQSGLTILGTDGAHIFIQDPTCWTANIIQLLGYAWIVIVFMTGILLTGWAFSLIRGTSEIKGMVNNLRSLVIIFATLSVVGPIVNFIYGDDLWGMGCRVIVVPTETVQELVDARTRTIRQFDPYALWESIDIWDSAVRTDLWIPPNISDIEFGAHGVGVFTPRMGAFGATTGRLRGGRYIGNLLHDQNEIENVRRIFRQSGMGIRRDDDPTGGGHVGASRANGMRDHEGRDFLARPGQPMPAFFDGEVVSVQRMGNHGLRSILIRNTNGTLSFIGYVDANVNAGQRVSAGQIIGRVQNIAMNPAYRNVPNHVHFELWQDRGTLGQSRSRGGTAMDLA
ncbi:MAG: M23 family metallopeptidase, partial [Alphaproteobacteria bacterium]|nr:M23 family metallopeptidase [Alphaproteobacteria bacterium]